MAAVNNINTIACKRCGKKNKTKTSTHLSFIPSLILLDFEMNLNGFEIIFVSLLSFVMWSGLNIPYY